MGTPAPAPRRRRAWKRRRPVLGLLALGLLGLGLIAGFPRYRYWQEDAETELARGRVEQRVELLRRCARQRQGHFEDCNSLADPKFIQVELAVRWARVTSNPVGPHRIRYWVRLNRRSQTRGCHPRHPHSCPGGRWP